MPRATPLCVRCLGLLAVVLGFFNPVDLAKSAEASELANRALLPSARPYEVRGSEQRLLARFERSLERAQWEDALDLADQLLASDSRAVVAVDQNRYVSLHKYCHRILSQLPAEVLDEYRALVDAPAEVWYRQGVAERSESLLQRVIDESFCSRWGDDALYALGELALERGEYFAARMYLEAIGASLRDSNKSFRVTYPDTDINLAEVQACLVLVSLREGDLERTENEIERLFVQHGDARGRLGGREVVLTEELEKILEHAQSWPASRVPSDWPTYGGGPSRVNSRPARLPKFFRESWSHRLGGEGDDRLSVFPIVTGNLVLWQDASQVHALRLDSGKVAFRSRGAAFESTGGWVPTLMTSGNHVYGTTIKSSERRRVGVAPKASQIWALDLKRDGALSLRKELEEAGVEFAGPPLVVGSQLFVTIRAGGNSSRVGIACYDLATNEIVWRQWICQSSTPSGGGKLGTSNLLTYEGGIVFCSTNSGAIAAVRARDGQVQWIRTYERAKLLSGAGGDLTDFRLPNPCVFSRGTLFVAPAESDELLALKASTGELQWQREMASLTGEIIGAVDGKILVSDRGLKMFEAPSGEVSDANTDLRLFGQPAIAGDLVFWPSYQQIELIDLATGIVREQAVPLAEQGGANLVVVGDYLVAAGRTHITVYRFSAEPIESTQEQKAP